MTTEAFDLIREDFLRIRASSKDGSIPITARQLEAYVRLAEASAKLHLRDTVEKEDAQRSINLIGYYLKKIASNGDSYDIDLAGGSFSNKERKQSREMIYNEIKNAVGGISAEQIKNIMAAEGISSSAVDATLDMLCANVAIYRDRSGVYKVIEDAGRGEDE